MTTGRAAEIAGRTVESLSRLERQWMKRRICGFCEVYLTGNRCGALSGLYTLPVIEGVRDKEEVVDLGPPCDMDQRRAHALQNYHPRKQPAVEQGSDVREQAALRLIAALVPGDPT